ncbi:MAG: OmpA family protein [Alphaproteobacteria bacterium]|jgi:outer membrane protein OmpA-like peptidoglycan-associated protein|nr:OmpA family protein [Alphaproteobacteria bacterium]
MLEVFKKSKKSKKSMKFGFVLLVIFVSFLISLRNADSRVLIPDYDETPVSDYKMEDDFYSDKFVSMDKLRSVSKSSYLAQIQALDFYGVNNDNMYLKFLGIYYKSYAFYMRDYLGNSAEAEHFAKKALLAYKGQTPVVDDLNSRRINVGQAVDLSLSIDRFREALNAEIYIKYPLDMAYSQVNLDCWLERQSNNSAFHQMASCQNAFYKKMDKIFESYDRHGCIECEKKKIAMASKKSVKEVRVSETRIVETREVPKIPLWDIQPKNSGAKKHFGDSRELIEYKRLVKELTDVQKAKADAEQMNAKRMAILQEELAILRELVKQSKKKECTADKPCPDVSLDEIKAEIAELKKLIKAKSVPGPEININSVIPASRTVESKIKVIDVEYQEAIKKKVEKEAKGEEVVINFPVETFFDWDQSTLKSKYRFLVEDAAKYIKKNKLTSVVVEGHADTSGDRSYNMKLSQRRADAVKNALISYDVPNWYIKTVAKGEEDLKVQTGDGIANPENRRAVILIK